MSLTHQMFLQSLREVEGLAADAFDDYRAALIDRLLNHMWRETAYVRDRLSPLMAGDGFDIDRWAEIPVLRSSEVMALGTRIKAGQLPQDVAESETVSRNDFLPVQERSVISRIAAECTRELIYELGGINSAAKLAVLHPDHAEKDETGKGWSVTFPDSSYLRGEISAGPESQAEWLARTGSKRLRTTSALAERLAETQAAPALEVIVIADDTLPSTLRKRLEERFGAHVIHIVERPVIGPVAAVPAGNGECLVASASMIVEVVDGAARPVAAGETGELVVTPLYEYANPLLRLATGLWVVAQDGGDAMLGVRRIATIAEAVSG